MKYIFTFLIFIGLSSSAFGAVGDVYYCVSDYVGLYNSDDKRNGSGKEMKFKFKWNTEDGKDYIQFSDFYLKGLSLKSVQTYGEEHFNATNFGHSVWADSAYFNLGLFQYNAFYATGVSITIYATCSKF